MLSGRRMVSDSYTPSSFFFFFFQRQENIIYVAYLLPGPSSPRERKIP